MYIQSFKSIDNFELVKLRWVRERERERERELSEAYNELLPLSYYQLFKTCTAVKTTNQDFEKIKLFK